MKDYGLIRWPEDMRPAGAPVFTSNELALDVSAERAWAWLVRAAHWPSWYRHCRNLRFVRAPGPDLALGTRFSWTTFFNVPVVTDVVEFEPPFRLAWQGAAAVGRGYHAWLIEPRGSGCWVLTDETQRGPLPWLARAILRPKVYGGHQEWLECLGRTARSGPPPG